MNYSQSAEDYRQLSVDYSDSNSISESTSLILSNQGHRKGKIFLKDYGYKLCNLVFFFWSPQMWTTHAQPGDRYSHALVVTWLGRHVWPRCRERSFYTGFLFPCALLLRPTRQHHRVFLHAPFARWSCSADHKVWQHVSATWCPETDEKPCSYPTYTAMSRWQHQNQLNLWTIPDTNKGD